jgi:hypothetical protein
MKFKESNEGFMFGTIIELLTIAENDHSDKSIKNLVHFCHGYRCIKPEDDAPCEEVYPRIMLLADNLYASEKFPLAYKVYSLSLHFINNSDNPKWVFGYFRMMTTALKFNPQDTNMCAQKLAKLLRDVSSLGFADNYFLDKLMLVAKKLEEWSNPPGINYRHTAIVVLKIVEKHATDDYKINHNVAGKLRIIKNETLCARAFLDRHLLSPKKRIKTEEAQQAPTSNFRL